MGGYLPDGGGVILKTTDGGTNWTELKVTDYNLITIFFADANTGYAAGYNGTILKTMDGGTSWTDISFGTNFNYFYNSVYFTDPNTGYLVGGYYHSSRGVILKTIDGGANWNFLECGAGTYMNSVYFPETNTGYAVGGVGTILKTDDGGGPMGVNEITPISNSLKIYPNPASGNITLETPETGTLSVYNLNGILVLEQKITKQTTTIDVSKLSEGLYVLKVVGEKKVFVGKFMKN